MKNKFILGLVTALVLGIIVNIILNSIKSGYPKGQKQAIDKDVKNCKDLVSGETAFGNLKVTIIGKGKPVENLEVDLSRRPGPVRCMQKTDKDGVALFTGVPSGKMVIYFNTGAFPRELGKDPTIYVEIVKDKTVEKLLELPYK